MSKRLVEMEFGSTVYGTKLPTSDADFKGIFIPDARDIVLQRAKKVSNVTTKIDLDAKSTSKDIEWEWFSLQEYIKLLLEGQTVALTMLFMPEQHIIYKDNDALAWNIIRNNKDKFLHRGVSAFAGYCRTQANKYGIKGSRVAAAREACNFFEVLKARGHPDNTKLNELAGTTVTWVKRCKDIGIEHIDIIEVENNNGVSEKMLEVCNRKAQFGATIKSAYDIFKRVFDEYGSRALMAEKNEGVDWKACMHAVRVAKEAEELLLTGNITYPRPEAELLLQIRKGELPYKQVAELIEEGLDNLELASAKSSLPEKPDFEFAENLIFETYKRKILHEQDNG